MDIEKMLKHMAWANREIIGEISKLPKEALDAYAVNPEWTVGTILRHVFKRSVILSQAVHHATEHRAQAVAAFEAKGIGSINLDNYDVWSFSIRVGG